MKGLISIGDLSKNEIFDVLQLALRLKDERSHGTFSEGLQHKTLGMIFEKPSTRTRTAFEVAIVELGGYPIYLNWNDLQLGRGETIADTARVLSKYLSGIVLRAACHSTIVEMADYASIPVINALSDLEHPCQLLADLMTIYEKKGTLSGLKLVHGLETEITSATLLYSLVPVLVCASTSRVRGGMNRTLKLSRGVKSSLP